MQKLKYKLVCTKEWGNGETNFKAGEVITNNAEKIMYTGPWGQIQADSCAEWQENSDTVSDKLSDAKQPKQSTIKALLAATDYKTLKYTDGDISAEEYAPIKTYRAELREAFRAIDAATTAAEVDAVIIP